MEHGETKWRSRDNIVYAQWMDTKHVHVLLTAFAATDIITANRRQKDGSIKVINCPRLVAEYTARMGGVDRIDQKTVCYGVSRRSKRRWLQIFYFLFDTAVVNAHALHSEVNPAAVLDQLNFRVQLLRGLLGTFASRKRQQPSSFVGRRRSHKGLKKSWRVPENIRTASVGVHMPQILDNFRRCRLCSTSAGCAAPGRTTKGRKSSAAPVECHSCHSMLCELSHEERMKLFSLSV